MKSSIKWSPSVPLRKPDSIVSSRARENGEVGFIPSYEKDPDNMTYIMCMEYRRIWFKERGAYAVETYAKLDAELKTKVLIRKIIPKKPFKKREKKLPIITLKQFKNVPSKMEKIKLEKKDADEPEEVDVEEK